MNAFPMKMFPAAVLAALLAACGGGNGSNGIEATPADDQGNPPADVSPAKGLALTGTAATGLALADASVSVKCASGAGSASTDASGQYVLNLADGAKLPCMVRVTGTAKGSPLTLHSLVEAGTVGNGTTNAIANVSPLTELILAQLFGQRPAAVFDAFGGATVVDAAVLQAATGAMQTALKDAGAVDFTSTDPFKAPLVAATPANPGAGNAHDALLDQLAQVLPRGAFDVLTDELARTAAATGANSATVKALITSVAQGALPGCTVAKSGAYRTIDFRGVTGVHQFDFKTFKVTLQDGSTFDLRPIEVGKPCELVAAGTGAASAREIRVVLGASGAGAYLLSDPDAFTALGGHIFPAQTGISQADLGTGDWTALETTVTSSGPSPRVGKWTIHDSDTLSSCVYMQLSELVFGCAAPSDRYSTTRPDGGWDLREGSSSGTVMARVYAFRAPDGSYTLYATSNADGTSSTASVVVLARPATLGLPLVGHTEPRWVAIAGFDGGVDEVGSATLTVSAVNTDDQVVTWQRDDSAQITVLSSENDPIDGVSTRDGAWLLRLANGVEVEASAAYRLHIRVPRP